MGLSSSLEIEKRKSSLKGTLGPFDPLPPYCFVWGTPEARKLAKDSHELVGFIFHQNAQLPFVGRCLLDEEEFPPQQSLDPKLSATATVT